MRAMVIALAVAFVLGVVILVGGIRIFVLQPIGAVPDGVTVVFYGMHRLKLIDSADAICFRQYGGVSLICRGSEMALVAQEGRDKILFRLPYSDLLFRLTGGPFR